MKTYKTIIINFIFVLLAFSSISFSITIVEPTKQEVDNSYYAGFVGPGQVLSIAIDKRVETGGRFGKGGYYDKAYALKLPDGWTSEQSKIFDNPLQVFITVPENAKEGNYSFLIQLEDLDNAELLGNKTINITVTITKDVMDMEIKKLNYIIAPKQPLRLSTIISNKGNAGDIFVIDIKTSREIKRKEVFIPANSISEVVNELSFPAKGKELIEVNVYSKHAPSAISKSKRINVQIEGNFFEDLGAAGNGVLLLFIPFQPVYDISYLIYSVFSK
ncbi:MAG: hypothetical protein QXI89_01445 [Candidatus Anstonellales archaeon]